MSSNTPRQDLIRKSSVKIMDLNLGWPLEANEAATVAVESEAPAVCM